MWANYLRIAARNFLRNKGHSLINVTGLGVGMACAILIFLWVRHELSYDRFHPHAGNLYRVAREVRSGDNRYQRAITPGPLAAALREKIPEVITAARCDIFGEWFLQYDETGFREDGCCFADPEALQMFSFPFVSGDPQTALNNPHSIVLSEKLARKYFPQGDALDKVLRIDGRYDLQVTGIIQDVPDNSSLNFNFMVPFTLAPELNVGDIEPWGYNSFTTYALLRENVDLQDLNHRISELLRQNVPETRSTLYLQPFLDIHLFSNLQADLEGRGSFKYILIFASLALTMLLVACANFMNLATAQSIRRTREIGMRKVVGAFRLDIVLQFLNEAILNAYVALIFAVALVEMFLPAFNNLAGKQLQLGLFSDPAIFLGLIAFATLIGLFSGSYPALFLSNFGPMTVLKQFMAPGNGSPLLRQILVVMQFSLAITLIIGAVLISRQLHFMQNIDLGYDKEHVIHLDMGDPVIDNYDLLKTALLQNTGVSHVSASFQLPTDISSSLSGMNWEGKDPREDPRMNADFVEFDYFETLGMKIIQGRSFSREFATDAQEAFIINETAAKTMGMEVPVGKKFSMMGIDGTIIGVVKDFHSQSLHSPINPVIFKIMPDWKYHLYIRFEPGNERETLAAIEETWKQITPDYPFTCKFLDDTIESLYWNERRMEIIVDYVAALTIFISCLGLFGLASFMIQQRTKEIGIRKVLGAPVSSIARLMTRDFVFLVAISNLVAWPLAYHATDQWLQNFAYRTSLSVDIFLLAGLAAMIIAMATVGYQVIKAASTDPVKALRYE